MSKISVCIEANSASEYADALQTLCNGLGQRVAAVEVEDDAAATETPAQAEDKKKSRTKAEIKAEKAAAAPAPVNVSETTPPAVQEQPAAPVVANSALTLDTLRNLAMPINKHNADGKAAVVNLIKTFGVVSFGQIPEEKFPEVKAKLEAIAFDFGIELGL